ncbi:MAG: hypothetical protein ACE5O2_17300 [Armatimonadota bacterium]
MRSFSGLPKHPYRGYLHGPLHGIQYQNRFQNAVGSHLLSPFSPWRNWGRWHDRQLVPETWMGEATKTAPDIRANCPREQWRYGYGFWTNEHGLVWPNLPRDSYAAAGADGQLIWVCPSLDVVVQGPGLYETKEDEDRGLLRLVVEACQQEAG